MDKITLYRNHEIHVYHFHSHLHSLLDDNPSTWVTEAEMHARQFVNPFSDQRD